MDILRYLSSEMWLSPDKGLHFLVSASVAACTYGWTLKRHPGGRTRAVIVALGAVTLLGLTREASDAWLGKYFSEKDILWNSLGVVLGIAVVSPIQHVVSRLQPGSRA